MIVYPLELYLSILVTSVVPRLMGLGWERRLASSGTNSTPPVIMQLRVGAILAPRLTTGARPGVVCCVCWHRRGTRRSVILSVLGFGSSRIGWLGAVAGGDRSAFGGLMIGREAWALPVVAGGSRLLLTHWHTHREQQFENFFRYLFSSSS